MEQPTKKRPGGKGGGNQNPLGPMKQLDPKNIWKFFGNMGSSAVIFILIIILYIALATSSAKVTEVPLSELAVSVSKGDVKEIIVEGDKLTATYSDDKKSESVKESDLAFSQTLINYGVTPEKLSLVHITVKEPGGFGYWFANLAPFLIPLVFIAFLVWYLTKQMRGAGTQAMTFGQSKARIIFPGDKKQRVTFKDIAGAKEAKQELSEIVDFLKNPKKFIDIGAQIPKGVLLMGAPGTGKTLLARAVAGEAGVAFFSISGSEFVEMFVGVGASRVRDLFRMAKQSAPAIIFVDEIDAVGRVRGAGTGGGNDEREQTLNQILVEMDGFDPNEKVIVMAATNRPDVLDPALLRPGRFDRRVTIDLPDRGDREEILKIHARKKQFAEDVNLKLVAERTPGFSGADLYSLMNEAAILAAREDRVKIAQFDLIRAIEKVMLGPERKSHILSKKEKEVTAYHEAGHALVASVLEHADPVHKISIISRGRAAGYVLHLPIEDKKLQSRNEFYDDIAVSLGGYASEKLIFGDVTTGPSNDLQVSTALARDMVTKYGMSDKIGVLALEGAGGRTLFGHGVDGEMSEKISADVDSEVQKIMSDAMTRTNKVLKDYRKVLDVIAKRLIETETIERQEFDNILVANGITLKQEMKIADEK